MVESDLTFVAEMANTETIKSEIINGIKEADNGKFEFEFEVDGVLCQVEGNKNVTYENGVRTVCEVDFEDCYYACDRDGEDGEVNINIDIEIDEIFPQTL